MGYYKRINTAHITQDHPTPGHVYCYTDRKGYEHEGRVEKIARMRTGAVLAFFENGKGYPVSKYGKWELKEV